MYDFLDAMIIQQTSPEEVGRHEELDLGMFDTFEPVT